MFRRLLSTFALCLACIASAQGPPSDAPPFVDGVVLVGFQEGATGAQRAAVVAAVGADHAAVIGARTHVLRVPAGAVMHVVNALRMRPEVRYAEPDWIGHADGVPNDPSFGSQWAFQNSGKNVGGMRGVVGADEKAVRAWDFATGTKSVVVGVTDTGIEYTHSDLRGNVWSNPGGINGCAAGTHGYNVLTGTCDPMDNDTAFNGHGTHVAGIIGATTNNAVGVAGVNWNTNLLAVKWLDSNANGTTSNLITALDWLVRAKQAGVNVRVVNDSATFVGTAFSQALSDEIDVLGANDILFVTAAGNSAQSDDNLSTRRYPCGYMRPNELCVGASDNTDHLWSSSNFGVQTVNLAAPGYDIYSTLRGNTYGYISGCSMSAGQVSGAAALILATGYRSATALRAAILNNVDVLASLNGLVQTSGRLNLCKPLPGCSGTTTTSTTTTIATTTTITTTTTIVGATTTTTTLPSSNRISLVQSNAVEGTSVAALSSAFGSNNSAGNLIVAFVRMSSTSQTVTVTDTNHNAYTDAVAQSQTTDGHQVHVFYAKSIASGPNTVTATFSAANNHPWLAIYEYRGLSTTSPLDQTAHAQGSSTTAASGATAPTTTANELVFVGLGVPATYTGTVAAGSGYTLLQQDAGTSRAATEGAFVTTTGSYTGIFGLSSSTNWAAVVATFAAAPVTTGSSTTTTTTSSTTTTATSSSTTTTIASSSTTTTIASSSTTTTTPSSTSTTTTSTTTSTTSTTIPVPVNIDPPTISGTAQQGQTLTTSNGTWSNNPTSYAYGWRRCNFKGRGCQPISGAASQTYTLVSGDVGGTIRSVVTATNPGGSTSATSEATGIVQGP